MSIDISVVIPIHNEEENVEALHSELDRVLVRLGKTYEIIYVDDGSSDRSFDLLAAISRTSRAVRVIRLKRNFGQTAALSCGTDCARGEVIFFMDGDRQNDPADIPRLLDKLNEGFDVVSGWRKNRHDALLSRKIPSWIANWIISRVSGVHLHDYGCTLKAYRRDILKDIRLYGDMHRFIPALARNAGAWITETEVNHRPRTAGKTKYGLMRTFKVFLDLFTIKLLADYLTRPIHFFGGCGLVLGAVSLLCEAWVLYNKFVNGVFVKDQPLFQVGIFFFQLGFLIILIGLIAELVTRSYHESTGKKTYTVGEELNPPDGD